MDETFDQLIKLEITERFPGGVVFYVDPFLNQIRCAQFMGIDHWSIERAQQFPKAPYRLGDFVLIIRTTLEQRYISQRDSFPTFEEAVEGWSIRTGANPAHVHRIPALLPI